MTRIAVIGGGRIGEALISGLLQAEHQVKDLVIAEKSEARRTQLSGTYKVRVTGDVADAVEGAQILVVAVKPNDVASVVTEILNVDLGGGSEQVLVSLAAGIPTRYYEKRLPAGFPVVRVMPNTPMLVGAGMCVGAPGRHAKPEHLKAVREMLSAVGQVAVVKEEDLDAATAVSGSGPAYFFLFAEAMVDAGVGLGLGRDTAMQLVTQTMMGSAAMLADSGQTPNELKAGVTSPAGTTAAALREFERHGLRTGVWESLVAAAERSVELGRLSE
jgi:pyrroline-5-carboxylate reductase